MDGAPQLQRYETMYRSLSGELIALKVMQKDKLMNKINELLKV